MPVKYADEILDVKTNKKAYVFYFSMPDGTPARLTSMNSNLASDCVDMYYKKFLRNWKLDKRRNALATVKRLTDNLNAEKTVLNKGYT